MRMRGEAALLNGLWVASAAPDELAFASATRRVEGTQAAYLLGLVRRHAGTVFGRRHEFDRIRTVADFRARVPVAAWEDFREDIEAVRRGEPGRLAAGVVERLVPTSGSTAPAKLVPCTAALRREFLRGVNPWICGLFRRFPGAARGRAYWSISPPMTGMPAALPGGPPVGFEEDRDYLGWLGGLVFDRLRVAASALAAVPDADSFKYATLRCLLAAADLSLVSVWHPGFLGTLLDAAVRWREPLLADLRDGTLRPPQRLPDELARRLARGAGADPARARSLASILARDPVPWTEVWPRLAVVSCWEDAAAAPGVAALRARLPGVSFEGKGLLATEGITSFPWVAGSAPALAITSHFFEFVERDALGAGRDGAVQLAHEVETGGTYAVLLTTGGGLYRYRIGDLVRVEGFAARCPLVRFLGREAGGVDLTGEKLHEAHVARVLRAVAEGVRIAPRFSMLAPESSAVDPGTPCYVWFVESGFPLPPASAWRDAAAGIESALAENPHYRHSRRMGQLGPVRVFVVDRGGEAAYIEARTREGRRAGDVKPAALDGASGWSARFSGRFADSGREG